MKQLRHILLLINAILGFLLPRLEAAPALHRLDLASLSNNAIICLHQDPTGYIWVGTYDGLNLFNGQDTYTYRFEQDYKLSLCSNIILYIADAEPGCLWISTSLGFNKFSTKERKVTAAFPGYINCTLLATNTEGTMVAISRTNQITCYLPELNTVCDVPLEGINPNEVVKLINLGHNSFGILLRSGVMRKITPVYKDGKIDLQEEQASFHFQAIHFAASEGERLFLIDEQDQLYDCDLTGGDKRWIASIEGMREQMGSIIHIFTYQSAYYIGFRQGQIVNLQKPTESIDVGLGVFWVMPDAKLDLLWIGTDGQGIQLYYDKPTLFGSILQNNLPLRLQNPIRSIFTDSDGSLWLGTKGDGIVRIEHYADYSEKPIPAKAVTHFTTKDGLTHNRVYCLCPSAMHPYVWIGTEGPGLTYYDKQTQRFHTMKHCPGSEQIHSIHRIYESDDSTLWFSSTENGLFKAKIHIRGNEPEISDLRGFAFRKGMNVSMEIQDMVPLNDSILLLGNRGGYGVISLNMHNESYTFLQKDSNDHLAMGDILSVEPLTDRSLLIGGSSGLLGAVYQESGFHVYPIQRNRSTIGMMIHGILRKGAGEVWISTNKGLVKYNPDDHIFIDYQHPIIPVEEFSDDAYWHCPHTGRLFFGGVNGLVWINPLDKTTCNDQAKLSLFEVKIDGETWPFDSTAKQGDIHVPSGAHTLSITLAVPDYQNCENGTFAYQLEGYSTDWIELQRNNQIKLNSLPPGDYTLRLRYRTDVNAEAMQERTVSICVEPPFFLKPWVIISCLLIIACIYGLIVHWWIRKRYQERQIAMAKKMHEEQKEKLYEAKLNFFTQITHELCSPLTLINGADKYIQQYAAEKTDPDLYKYSTILRNNVTELNNLIQEILDFRKAEDEGFARANIKQVAIGTMVQQLHQWFQPLAEQRQIQFTLEQNDELTWPTDAIYFKKIMTNLLSNAFKYTPQGEQVSVRLTTNSDNLQLSVKNTGIGLSDADCQRLFDRYSVIGSTDCEPQTSRHGLGLFICKSMVKALNGEIEVESTIGEYVEFIVRLPLLETTTKTTTTEEKAGTEIAPPPAPIVNKEVPTPNNEKKEKPHILVVDDHKDIVWLIQQTLSDSYLVEAAYNGEEALERIRQHTPRLIITDLMMPKVGGLELIEQLKQDRFTRHIPLVIVSAKISEKEQAEGIKRGANAYLTKPFSPDVLHSMVDRLVSNQQEMKDYFYSPESAYQINEGQLLHQEDKEFIQAVNDIVGRNIKTDGFGPEQIADELHLNSRMFYRRFKRITNSTPSDFIKSYRFNRAAQLLVNTTMSVQQVMFEVGINSKSYFYREFARQFNLTPTEYRESGGK